MLEVKKDDFDETPDDILKSIQKLLEQQTDPKEKTEK